MAEPKRIRQFTKRENDTDLGRIAPHSTETEEVVLGQLMLEEDAVISVMDILKPESFYKDTHQKIFSAIQELAIREEPVNILTVTEQLKRKNSLDAIGGYAFISQLSLKVSTAAHVEHHAKLVAQAYIQRELIRVAREIQEQAYDSSLDVADLLDFSESAIFTVAEGNVKKETSQIGTLIPSAIKQIEEAGKKGDGLSGTPSGFTNLDRITSGWQGSNMIVLAARPAMGKTAFVLSMLRNMATEHNIPVAMFSLEMSNLQLVNRLIVSETELPHNKIRVGNLTAKEWQILEERTKNLIEAPIFLDDTPALSIFEFRAKCRRLKQKHDIQCVFIDYLQLMTSGGAFSREQEVSTISRQIKAVAMELNIPIIALSQLNRSVELRGGDKRPQLSDLRESGAIEQDADLVMFIHRPEYYGITEDEEGNSLLNIAEIIIAKNRHGGTDNVKLKFTKELAKFSDLEIVSQSFENMIMSEAQDINANIQTFSSKMNNQEPSESEDEDIFGSLSANSNFENEDAPF
jgi:replicative DNA helicase